MVPEIDTFIENLNSVGYLLKRTKDIPGMMAFSLPGLLWFVWLQSHIIDSFIILYDGFTRCLYVSFYLLYYKPMT